MTRRTARTRTNKSYRVEEPLPVEEPEDFLHFLDQQAHQLLQTFQVSEQTDSSHSSSSSNNILILDEDTISEEFHVISNLPSWKHLNTYQFSRYYFVYQPHDMFSNHIFKCQTLKGHVEGLNDPIGNILLGGEDIDFSPIVSTCSLNRLFVSTKFSENGNEAYFTRLKDLNVMDQLCEEDHVVDMCFGSVHTLLCTRRGRVFGFGNNQFGQLGLGNEMYITKPREIIMLDEHEKQVSVRHIYACHNTSFFVCQNNKLYWTGNSRQKTVQQANTKFSSKIKQISGTDQTIAIVCENGDFYLSPTAFGSFELHSLPYKVLQCATFSDKIVILTDNHQLFSVDPAYEILTRIRLELPLFEHVESVRASRSHCFFLTSNREIYCAKSSLQPVRLIMAPPLPPHFKWFLSTQNSSDFFCVFVKKYSHLKRQNWFFGNLLASIRQNNPVHNYCDILIESF
ncbi:hypothetical protein C9374_008784 [Naegleria lovaniensis]|uniref:Uncharacterized protein n=1 Tax=Naegleria lovaniensis TaxID=51637 RepID=A0AA88KFA7_NAELO|nr:uncharacterized protein C9374_008784 [Naegleria lovaniensis]KAG2378162.1 hypothetical protein C9374_008784 [Naegleria lovaniensis]